MFKYRAELIVNTKKSDMNLFESKVRKMLAYSNIFIGTTGDGDMEVRDDRFYEMVAKERSMGIGNSFVLGYWSTPNLKKLAVKFLNSQRDFSKHTFLSNLYYKYGNAQNKILSKFNVLKPYDKDLSFYKSFLDKRLVYSCGYWNNLEYSVANLDLAQEQKLDLICQKLGLHRQPRGRKILDVGCGFGGFAKYASEKYGACVVGITLSSLQFEVAKEVCKGLPIEIRFQDYRDVSLKESFDHIVSVGMFEHVGSKNYRKFISKMKKHLRDEDHGENFFLLHTIFTHSSKTRVDPWIERRIFPGAEIPSTVHLFQAILDLFVCEDFHDFGMDYSLTADAWHERFEMNYSDLTKKQYQQPEFKREQEYYFQVSSASFVTRRNDLVQMLLSHHGVLGGKEKVREIFPKKET